MFAAGGDAAAGVAFAFAFAVDAARLRLPSAFGFFAFVPIEVATASGGPTRVLLRVETIATRPALSSRVAVANVQANAEDIVETRDARCARVFVSHSRRTRHRINQSFYFADTKTSIEERFVTPSPVRCGWAWGTPYAGDEEAAGIDALGFLSDADMLAEMRSWRAMVVPILRTTGVNTKLLPALQYSVPLVLTSVAASPLGIPLDGSVALVADDAPRFLAHLTALLDEPALQRRLSAASGHHWRHLLQEDAGATDLLPILAASCAGMAASPRVRFPFFTPGGSCSPPSPLPACSCSRALCASAAAAALGKSTRTMPVTESLSGSISTDAATTLRCSSLAFRSQ